MTDKMTLDDVIEILMTGAEEFDEEGSPRQASGTRWAIGIIQRYRAEIEAGVRADDLALIRDLADVLEEARSMVNKFSTRSYRNGAEEEREKWLNSKEIIALIARARKVAK